jgi:hypothetical protein
MLVGCNPGWSFHVCEEKKEDSGIIIPRGPLPLPVKRN